MPGEAAHFFLRDLALILVTAALATVTFQRLRLPVIVGYLVAGMLVGPLAPTRLIRDPGTIETLAELGVVLLLFSIGLEFRLRRLATLGPRVALATVVEVGLMLLLGFSAARLLGWDTLQSMLAGGLVAISSTMVVSRALADTQADRRLKDIVFGVLVMEDLFAIILIAVLTTVATGDSLSGPLLARTLTRLGLFLTAMIVAGMLVVPRAVRAAVSLKRAETTLVASVGICFLFALLSAMAGYSVALGGFIAGALVAESGAHHIVAETVRPVRDLFAAIFFVAVGMLFDPAVVTAQWDAILLLFAVVVAGKVIGVSLGVFLAGYGTRDAVRSGMTLAQIGEFAFVIVGIGSAGRGGSLYPIAVAVATLTAFTTPYFVRRAAAAASWVDRRLPHRVQTFSSLYASWLDLMMAGRREVTRASRTRRMARFLILDAAIVTAVIIGTSIAHRRLPEWLDGDGGWVVRFGALAAGGLVALPFGIGLVRTVRKLAFFLAEGALPRPAKGLDQAHAPRRALEVALQFGLSGAVGVPMALLTLPFVPPFGVTGVAVAILLLLGVAFWRTTTDLESHARAGAELIVHVLAKQGHEADPRSFEVVRDLLPGLGTIVPLEVAEGSEAVGRTLGELSLRGRTGATVVALSRAGQRHPFPPAGTELRAGDMLALTGSADAIGAAAALLRARGTSSPPSARGATAPPAGAAPARPEAPAGEAAGPAPSGPPDRVPAARPDGPA
ncbi:MAG TPA: cation:proton antiporter [Gemmatimonadales bacterium]|nr:cation:proton antiporter [Gemmatimonadales bacterium]